MLVVYERGFLVVKASRKAQGTRRIKRCIGKGRKAAVLRISTAFIPTPDPFEAQNPPQAPQSPDHTVAGENRREQPIWRKSIRRSEIHTGLRTSFISRRGIDTGSISSPRYFDFRMGATNETPPGGDGQKTMPIGARANWKADDYIDGLGNGPGEVIHPGGLPLRFDNRGTQCWSHGLPT